MSTTTIVSSRFGTIDVAPEAELEFPSGLIGISGTRYTLLAREEDSTFLWLQSLDDGEFALPVVNPWRFFGEYEVEISDDEAARIGLDAAQDTEVYVTVRAADALEDFAANLRAPILVSAGRGFQVLNESPSAVLQAPLLAGLANDRDREAA